MDREILQLREEGDNTRIMIVDDVIYLLDVTGYLSNNAHIPSDNECFIHSLID